MWTQNPEEFVQHLIFKASGLINERLITVKYQNIICHTETKKRNNFVQKLVVAKNAFFDLSKRPCHRLSNDFENKCLSLTTPAAHTAAQRLKISIYNKIETFTKATYGVVFKSSPTIIS